MFFTFFNFLDPIMTECLLPIAVQWWRVAYFRKLLFETNNEKFTLRRVNSKKISRHPGGNLSQSGSGDER